MKQNFALTLSLMGGLLLLTACVKEKTDDEKLRPVGSEIVFSAATSYDNEDGTRTVYTGKDQNNEYVSATSQYERINWENNDHMSIVYAANSTTQAEYKVTNVVNPNQADGWENNLADVEATGTKLVWGSGNSHVFYAMYPTASGNHANSAASLNGTTVSGTIPSTQNVSGPTVNQGHAKYLPDMKYAYMVGYANGSNISGNRVTIPFTPAVTAFNFVFKAASTVTVTGFELVSSSTTLAGSFNFSITGGKTRDGRIVGAKWGTVTTAPPSNDDNGKTISVSFGSSGKTLAENDYLDFTVFTLPIAQKGLTIKFHLKNGGAAYTKTIALKDAANTWHTFAAGKKHIITNDELAGDTVTYTFDVTFDGGGTSFNTEASGGNKTIKITSYATVSGSKIVPIKWEAYQYRVKNGNDPWTTWSSTKPDCLTLTTSGTPTTSAPTAVQSKSSSIAASASQTGTNALKNAAEKGTQSEPYDLSTHNYAGDDTGKKTTANCYIITSPGWYKFPLVYGNAYKNDVDNTMAYNPDKSSQNYYLKPFKKHSGTITGPSISGTSTATLVWQDANNLITPSSITKSGSFIVFHIEKDNIKEGNAVIAAKNSSGTILWSWHIWVTPFVNNVTSGNNNVSLRGKSFMARNLGWCDNGTIQRARRVQVQFRQPGAGSGTKTLTFIQGEASVEANTGTGPHYQWGRKDPMIPPKKGTASGKVGNMTWYDASGTSSTAIPIPQDLGPKSLEYSIQHPSEFIIINRAALPGSGGWLFLDWTGASGSYYGTGHYSNLWNYNATKDVNTNGSTYTVTDFNSLGKGKTVYDPCPPGYTVPLPTEMAALATNTSQMGSTTTYPGSGSITWDNTKAGYVTNNNLIPAVGFRFYNYSSSNNQATKIMNYRTGGWYHSSVYCSAHIPLNWYYSRDDNHDPRMSANYAKALGQSIRCVPE